MSGWNPPFLFSRLVLSGTRYLGHVPPALGALMFSFCSLFLEGHKDSVTCAGFSHDSTLVATGDMSGLLKVWQVDTKEEVWSFEAGDLEVRSSKWDSTLGGPWVGGENLGVQSRLYQTKPSLSQCTLEVQQECPCMLPRMSPLTQKQGDLGGAHEAGS